MITEGLRTLLLAQSSITTLAPSQVVNRITRNAIFTDTPPQGFEPPWIQITGDLSDAMLALDGTYGMRATDVDIDVVHRIDTSCKALAKVIREYLDDYSGAAGASDTINAVLYQDEAYTYDVPNEGRDTKFHIITLSFLIQHTDV